MLTAFADYLNIFWNFDFCTLLFFVISNLPMLPECSTFACFSELPNFPAFLVFQMLWPFSLWFSDSWIGAFHSTCNFEFSKISGCLSFLNYLAFPNVPSFLHVWFLLKLSSGFCGFRENCDFLVSLDFLFYLPSKYSENLDSENLKLKFWSFWFMFFETSLRV